MHQCFDCSKHEVVLGLRGGWVPKSPVPHSHGLGNVRFDLTLQHEGPPVLLGCRIGAAVSEGLDPTLNFVSGRLQDVHRARRVGSAGADPQILPFHDVFVFSERSCAEFGIEGA